MTTTTTTTKTTKTTSEVSFIEPIQQRPRGTLAGFVTYLRHDFLSGFLVFLIALPLCLGISIASGFPPIAGVFTAVVGSLVTPWLSNSELTIKGPAAGMIVIVLGTMTDLGFQMGGDEIVNHRAYQLTLAVVVVSGVVQIIFGLIRAGMLGDFFPTSAVHGMLAAIGIIIMAKQLPVTVGQKASGETWEILAHLPHTMSQANPEIALIGLGSLALLFGLGYWKSRSKLGWVKAIPLQLLVLVLAIGAGYYFDLSHEHTFSFLGHDYLINERFLVEVPHNLAQAVVYPDFTGFWDPATRSSLWKGVIMFALIGSLESMLSAKALDMIDPWKRKTNLNRDLAAVGVANGVAGLIGGLPMISEIVRSKANVDNGGRTRFANLWHGLCLLGFVVLLPGLIHRIPLAALAAMLVYTGFRLASPSEFIHVYRIGREQLAIFLVTLISVLATDLLIGIAIGIALKLAIHLFNGLPLRTMFVPYLEIDTSEPDRVTINAKGSAVFTNFIPFKRQVEHLGLVQKQNVIVDFSEVQLVDHSVMERLHEMQMDFEQAGRNLEIVGLAGLHPLSDHPYAGRRRHPLQRWHGTLWIPEDLQALWTKELGDLGIQHVYYQTGLQRAAVDHTPREATVKIDFFLAARRGSDFWQALKHRLEREGQGLLTLERVPRVWGKFNGEVIGEPQK